MSRLPILAATVLIAACGVPAPLGNAGPQSTESVAGSSSDFAGLTKCPDTGSWEDYLKAEQTNDPSSYGDDKAQWDKLKAAGADEGYVADYAQSPADCGGLTSNKEPKGKVVYVFVVRFKNEDSAKSSFKNSAKDFHLSDSDIADARAAGATVAQGATTGLGDNSIEAYGSLFNVSFFFGFWQNKQFDVGVITFNEPSADSLTRTKSVNGRIR